MKYPQPNPEDFQSNIAQLKIAVISAGLTHLGEDEANHSKLVRGQTEGVIQGLLDLGVQEKNIIEIECPGALEIPHMARVAIEKQGLDGVVAAALIVNGEIYRHEFVAQTSLDQLMQASVDTGVPIASSLLTPVAAKSTETQFEMLSSHLRAKGHEASGALIRQILQLKRL